MVAGGRQRTVAFTLLVGAACRTDPLPPVQAPTESPATTEPDVASDGDDQEMFRERVTQIAGELAALGFSTRTERLAIEYRTLADGFDDMVDVYDRMLRPTYFEAAFALNKTLGITEARDPREERALAVRSSLVSLAGYYQPYREAIVFLANPLVVPGDPDELVAHEMAHAHQDQAMGGFDSTFVRSLSLDQADVRDCLSEGYADAVAAAVILARDGADLRDHPMTADPLWVTPSSEEGSIQLLSYRVGRTVVYRRYLEAGWPAVHELLRDPPASTEQLLHPEKLDRDVPTPVRVQPLAAPAELRHEDTIGELTIYALLLAIGASYEQAYVAATGWDGDQLHAYRDQEGSWGIVWRLIWDRERDAEQFGRTLVDLVPSLEPNTFVRGRVVDIAYGETRTFDSELRAHVLGLKPRYSRRSRDARSTRAIERRATAAR